MKREASALEMNVMKMPPEPALRDELGRLVEGGRMDAKISFWISPTWIS